MDKLDNDAAVDAAEAADLQALQGGTANIPGIADGENSEYKTLVLSRPRPAAP